MDNELQIVVKSIIDNASEKNMNSQLSEISKKLANNNKINLKVAIDDSSIKTAESQLKTIAKQISTTASNINKTSGSSSQLQLFNTNQLKSDGQKYFINVRDIITRAQNEFKKLGSVNITNVFKNAQGDIQSFSASVTKANGVVEKFNFNLAKIQSGNRTYSGFVQSNSILTDKNAGTNLEQTLNYLNRINTKIADITSKTLTNTSKPLLQGMEQFEQFNSKLSETQARIQAIQQQNTTLSAAHKREINSMVADLQRFGKELQTSAYAATDLNAATFTSKKAELQAALQTDIQKWTNSGLFGGDFEAAVNRAKAQLDSALNPTDLEAYKHQLSLLSQQFKQLKLNSSASGNIIDADRLNSNIQTAQLRIQNLKNTYSSFVSDPNLLGQWQQLFDESKMVSTQKELTNLNAKIRQFEQSLISAGKHSSPMFNTLKSNIATMGSWAIFSSLLSGAIRGITGLYDSVLNLNTAMTELKKVTNEADSVYDSFLLSAADKSVEIGTNYSDFVTATADFASLGYNVSDASNLAETATIYSVVGDEVENIESATSSIISTMKAFGIQAEDSMSIVDKFNEVGNNFAISSGGIGEAMKRSASALAQANNTIDESIALIVAANNVIQDSDVVGTMYKTVSMRIRGAKTELEEAGLETEFMAESVSSLRDKIKGLTNVDGLGGFDIMLDSETFKSTYDIILGISEVWDKMSDIDQAALLELLAGKRQGNALAAAITNMDDAVAAMQTSVDAEGSALAEHEKWMDSIQAKQQQFSAQYQTFSNAFLSSDLIKGVYDTSTGILGWLTRVVEMFGSLPTLIATITPFFSKMQMFQTTSTKNWIGSGIGITSFIGASKISLENDKRLLDEYNSKIQGLGTSTSDLNKKQIVWNDTIANGSDKLKAAVRISDQSVISSQQYASATQSATTKTIAMGVASKASAIGVQALNTALNMMIGFGIGLAINAIISAFTSLSSKAEEAAAAAERNAQALKEQSNTSATARQSLQSLIKEYDELRKSSEGAWTADEVSRLTQIQQEITDLVGEQANNLDLVNGKIDTEYEKLLNIYGLLSKQEYEDAESYYQTTKQKLDAGYTRPTGDEDVGDSKAYWYITKAYEQLNDVEQNAAQKWWGEQTGINKAWQGDVDTALEKIGSYEEGLEKLYEWRRMLLDVEEEGFGYTSSDFWTGEEEWVAYDTADAISYLNSKITEFEDVIDEANAAKDRFFTAKANNETLDYLLTNDINSQEAFTEYVNSIYNDESISKDYAEALINAMQSYLPAFSIPEEIKRSFIADRDELINDIISEIPKADKSVIGNWLDEMSTERYQTFVDWWNQNKTSSVVTESDTSLIDSFSNHLERTQIALEGVASSGNTARDAVKELWESDDFSDTKSELMELAQTIDGITPDTIIELADESDALAEILELDGMNAEFLSVIMQSMANGGDGLSLITDEALKLNDALDGMTGKFAQITYEKSKYDAAMSAPEKDTNFRSYAEAFEELNAQFEAGTTNSNAFWAAAKFLFGEEQLNAWGWRDGLDEIYAAMEKNEAVFSDADSAGSGFIERLYEMSEAGILVNEQGEKLLEIGKDATGAYKFNIDPDNIDDIAEKMGLAEEAVLACFEALEMWGDVDFNDMNEVVEALNDFEFVFDTADEKVINLDRLNEQLLTLGKSDADIYDIVNHLKTLDGIQLISVSGNVDTLTASLENLNLATSDGVTITVDYEGLGDLLSNLGYTKDEAEQLIQKLGEANNITLANADGEVKSVSDALDYINSLTFTPVQSSLGNINDAIKNINDTTTDNVVSEVNDIGNAASQVTTKVYGIRNAINSIDGKTVTVYYEEKRKNSLLNMLGFAKGTSNAPAGKALVGEEGAELVKSGDKAYLVGEHGPEVTYLNAGDQVYTAEETKAILNGNSGKRIFGTIPAYATGRITTSGLRVETDKTGSSGTPYSSSSNNNSESTSSKTTVEAELDETTLEDQLEEMAKALDDILNDFEHEILLLENNNGTPEQIIAIYKQMQQAAHEQANKYRNLGLAENDDYIQDLQKQWFDYQKEIRDIQHSIYEDAVKEHENALSLLQNQYDVLYDRKNYNEMSQNLEKQRQEQLKIQELAHKEAERLRQLGIDENDDAIQECIDAWWNASDEIKDINSNIADSVIERFDEFIDLTDEFDGWNNLDVTRLDYLKQKLTAINKLYKDGILTLREYKELLTDMNIEIYNEQKDALTEIIEMTMDLIKQEAEDKIDALEEQIDDYQKIIDLKKEALSTSRDEEDYEREVAKRIAEIAEIQAKIAQLDRDDSREANAEKQALAQELADLQQELADYQADYAYEAQVNALDKEAETFEDTKNDEISIVESSIDTQEKLYNAAISRIESDWDQLYKDLIVWNETYGDMIDGKNSIASAWRTAKQAAEEYGSVVSALNSIKDSVIYEQNEQLNNNQIGSIVSQMYSNSQAWNSASQSEKDRLNQENLSLGSQLSQYGVNAVRGNDGVWYIGSVGGQTLFDKYKDYIYHNGGIVGEKPALNSNEVLAKLEIGEAVIPKDAIATLSAKLKSNALSGVLDSIINHISDSNTSTSGVIENITTNNADNSTYDIDINNEFNMQDMSDKSMKKYADYYAEHTIGKLLSATKRKGIKNSIGSKIL